MEPYPERPPAFLARYLRALVTSGEAARLGPNVLALLMAVGEIEDDQRWTGPVSISPDDLGRRVGLTHRPFLAARTMAVAAGWLGYRPGGRGTRPLFWLTIPPHLQCRNGTASGTANEQIGFPMQFQNGTASGTSTGGVGGGLSSSQKRKEKKKTPDPNPEKGGGVAYDPLAGPLPFGSEAFRAAWGRWVRYRRSRRLTTLEACMVGQLKKLAAMGEERAVACIEHSITSGYQGLFEEKVHGKGTGQQGSGDRTRYRYDPARDG